MNATLMILTVIALSVMAYLGIRYLGRLKPKTKTLAMAVWAAFGPYQTAEKAEDYLRTAIEVVFGSEGVAKHEEWIRGHGENYRQWEAEERLEESQNLLRKGLLLSAHGPAFNEAFRNFKKLFRSKAVKSMEWINKEYLENTGHRLEVTETEDDPFKIMYKKIWSDEKIAENEKEVSEGILMAIGTNLLNDESEEAKNLVEFLEMVYEINIDEELEKERAIGGMWLGCLEIENEDANSEIAKEFRVLNNAWQPPDDLPT